MYFAKNNKLYWRNNYGTLETRIPDDVHVVINTSSWQVTDIGSQFACAQAINNLALYCGEQSKIFHDSIVMDLSSLRLDASQLAKILNQDSDSELWKSIHELQSNVEALHIYLNARD